MQPKRLANQWAYLTSYSYNCSMIDVTSYGDDHTRYTPAPSFIEFSGVAPATPQILQAMVRWINRGNPVLPMCTTEWLCLYCGSPNPLPDTHCSQCGAPRNWLIG